jgi:hypothetical protein
MRGFYGPICELVAPRRVAGVAPRRGFNRRARRGDARRVRRGLGDEGFGCLRTQRLHRNGFQSCCEAGSLRDGSLTAERAEE